MSRAAQQRQELIARSAAAADADADGDGDEEFVHEQPPPRPSNARRRHCWVVLDDVDPMPGVVAAWQRTEAGWQARVSYVLGDATGGVVTGWLPAALLRLRRWSTVAALTGSPPGPQP